MLTHFVSLLVHAFEKIPSLVGSNWGGLIFAAAIFIITQAVLMFLGDIKQHWQKNVLIGFAVAVIGWFCLFIVAAIITVYDDHQNLGGAAMRIRKEGQLLREKMLLQSRSKEDALNAQIEGLRISCATTNGKNETLQEQNRDQQNTINGCLSQAIKLVTPEQLKVRWYDWPADYALQRADTATINTYILVVVNRTVQCPCEMTITIDQPFIGDPDYFLPNIAYSKWPARVSQNSAILRIDGTNLVPETPLVVIAHTRQKINAGSITGLK